MYQPRLGFRRGVLATISVLALAAGAIIGLRATSQGSLRQLRDRANGQRGVAQPAFGAVDTSALTRRFLLYYIIPIWLAAGVADWICHRKTQIERTTGAKESLMHLLMLAEVSIPITAGLFFEITAPVAAFLAHATALRDVSYAVTARNVTPIEQHAHSFLEMVPLMAISFIAVVHWVQFRALAAMGDHPADLSLRAKEQPLPSGYIPASLGATGIFELLPYLEELYRTLRASNFRLVPAHNPAEQ